WLNNAASKQVAMDVDARRTAHPIQQAIADESEAESVFDSITYSKSQAFIRELENYLGAEKFRDGIRRYMAAHAYSNATTADLWQALQTASGKQVAAIAAPYTEQPGVPLIVSSASCVNDRQRLTLRQERFTRGAGAADARAQLWEIPIAFGPPGAKEPSGVVLMQGKTMQIAARRSSSISETPAITACSTTPPPKPRWPRRSRRWLRPTASTCSPITGRWS